MDLILSEQVLLVALDDEKGTDRTDWGSDAGLAAGLLLDLAARDLVRAEDGRIVAVEGPDPGHPLLREAHAAIASEQKPRRAKHWVDRLPRALKPLKDRVADGLIERGVLTEERSKLLGLIPRTRYPEADPAVERALVTRMREVLVTGRAPSEEEALLAGLLEPLGLVDRVVEKADRRAARRRSKEIAEKGVAGDAVRDAVREVQTAVVVAAVVPATAATVSSG